MKYFVVFLDLETEAEIYEKLGYYLWSPGGNGQNARYQVSFDFGTNLTCDTKINDIKVLTFLEAFPFYKEHSYNKKKIHRF